MDGVSLHGMLELQTNLNLKNKLWQMEIKNEDVDSALKSITNYYEKNLVLFHATCHDGILWQLNQCMF